jgi:hypothetical protein
MLCLHLAWRPGKAVSAMGLQAAMERLWDHAAIRSRLWLNRGDSSFGQELLCVWHEATGQARPNAPLWGLPKAPWLLCLKLFTFLLVTQPPIPHFATVS